MFQRIAKPFRISIHALLAESDNVRSNGDNRSRISIHALLAESDARNTSIAGRITAFLSTLSLRRATYIIRYPVNLHTISIHALLAESDPPKDCACPPIEISIHALLAESDGKVRVVEPGFENISIHALLAESDLLNSSWISSIRNFYPRSPCGERPYIMTTIICTVLFLSTLSLRRATPF